MEEDGAVDVELQAVHIVKQLGDAVNVSRLLGMVFDEQTISVHVGSDGAGVLDSSFPFRVLAQSLCGEVEYAA